MSDVTAVNARSSAHRADNSTVHEAIATFQRGVDKEKNFQLLVERFHGPVLNFLARWTSSEQDRLDIAQEVFLAIYKHLNGYRGEAQFGTWVFRITHNTCMHWLRRIPLGRPDRDRMMLPLDQLDEDVLAAEADPLLRDQLEELIAQEDAERLRKHVASLPEQERRCLELYVYQELRYHEIARALRLSIGTVKAHLSHARARLRDRLNGRPR